MRSPAIILPSLRGKNCHFPQVDSSTNTLPNLPLRPLPIYTQYQSSNSRNYPPPSTSSASESKEHETTKKNSLSLFIFFSSPIARVDSAQHPERSDEQRVSSSNRRPVPAQVQPGGAPNRFRVSLQLASFSLQRSLLPLHSHPFGSREIPRSR